MDNSKFINADPNDIINNVIGDTHMTYSCFDPASIDDIEQCLATLITDISGSVVPFASDIVKLQKEVVKACKLCPRAENILLRNVIFSSNVEEIHGFIPLSVIDEDSYPDVKPFGNTALVDAIYNGIYSTISYCDNLIKKDFITNSCIYIITDGQDNWSKVNPSKVKELINDAQIKEKLIGKMYTVLIGLTYDPSINSYLQAIKDECNIDEYVSMGEASAKNLAKLAQLISKSISSHSQRVDSSILNF